MGDKDLGLTLTKISARKVSMMDAQTHSSNSVTAGQQLFGQFVERFAQGVEKGAGSAFQREFLQDCKHQLVLDWCSTGGSECSAAALAVRDWGIRFRPADTVHQTGLLVPGVHHG